MEYEHTRPARIVAAKGSESVQYRVLQALAQIVPPAVGRLRAAIDQRVGDSFGRDKGIRHNTAEQIPLIVNTELPRRFGTDQSVIGYEVEGCRVILAWIVVAGKFPGFELCQLARRLVATDILVKIRPAGVEFRVAHDDPAAIRF